MKTTTKDWKVVLTCALAKAGGSGAALSRRTKIRVSTIYAWQKGVWPTKKNFERLRAFVIED